MIDLDAMKAAGLNSRENSERMLAEHRAHQIDTARVAPEEAVFRPALPPSFKPGLNGTDMGTMTYKEQLLHPNWQRKRLEILKRADFHCESCGDDDNTLHVHHRRYIKGRMAWEYDNDLLKALCKECHSQEHDGLAALNAEISLLEPGELAFVHDLLVGLRYGITVFHGAPADVIDATLAEGEHGWRGYDCGAVARAMRHDYSREQMIALYEWAQLDPEVTMPVMKAHMTALKDGVAKGA